MRKSNLQATRIACMVMVSFLSSLATAAEQDVAPLISASELRALLGDDSQLRIIDMGPELESYLEAHIPSAQFVEWNRDITDPERPERYNIVDREGMKRLLRRLGIANDSLIVVYDDLDSRLAVRFYWSLRYYGHERVRVLDGGKRGWATAKLPFTADATGFRPTEYRIKKNAGRVDRGHAIHRRASR